LAILPPTIKPNQAGSGFTNLSRYLQANRSNKLGQTVASGVQQAGQQARGAVTQAGQQFQQKVGEEKARLGEQEQRAGQIIQGATGQTGDEDVKTVQNVLGAEFKGPTGVQNADEVRARAQEAESLARAGGSQAGRFGLLQRYVGQGRPAYSAGQQRLDQMLLGQTGQQQLRQARAGTVGVGSEAERQITAATEQGKELQGQARQVAESTKGKLGQSISDYDAAMAAQLASQQAQYQNILNQIGTPGEGESPIELDEVTLNNLKNVSGGVLGEGSTLYNADISPYVSINQLYNTKQAAQTQADLAKAQMLGKLGGQFMNETEQAKLLQQYTAQPEVAGKLAENPYAVSSIADLNEAIQQKKRMYDSGVGQEQAHLKNISDVGSGGLGVSSELAKRMIEDQYLGSEAARQQTLQDMTYDESKLRGMAMEAAKQQAGSKISNLPGEERSLGNLYTQIQQNEADRLAHEKNIENLGKQYKTFRTLKKKA
jgi:hypothetical protein